MTGKDLAKYREETKLNQEQFAKRIGIHRTSLIRIEKSQDPVSKSIIHKLNLAFESNNLEKPRHLIYYYDIDATAMPLEIFSNKNVTPTAKLDLPGYAGSQIAVNIAGHSMYPTIESGSMVLCKEVEDKSIILYGEVYLIVTHDYRMVKRVKKHPKTGWIIAASDNHNGHSSESGKTYDDIELPINKILYLYLVTGSIKRHQI